VTFLFSHGNAEDLGMIYDWFQDLGRLLHVNVMCYDYTGYGKSELGAGMGEEEIPNEQQVSLWTCERGGRGRTASERTSSDTTPTALL